MFGVGEARKARAESRRQDFEADLALRKQIWERLRVIEDALKIVNPEKDGTGSYYYTQAKTIDTSVFKGTVLYDMDYDATINPEYMFERTSLYILGQDRRGVFDLMDSNDMYSEMRYRRDGSTVETLDAIVAALQPQQPEQPQSQAPQTEADQAPTQEAA